MKLKAGDIFTIPVIEGKTGFGQIVNVPNKDHFIIVVFKSIYTGRNWPGISEIVEDEILFLGYTLDALLYHKYWNIIGNNTPNLGKINLPYYKLGTSPGIKVVDFKGNVIRKATKDEANKLNYQTVIAPIRY